MTLRNQGAMGECETRTQEALVAALRARPRTPYRAGQCVLVAKASVLNSLLEQPAESRHQSLNGAGRWLRWGRGDLRLDDRRYTGHDEDFLARAAQVQ
jgi:hypothetical protein